MSTDLTIDSGYDDTYSQFMLAPPLNYSDWCGRQITWDDDPGLRSQVEQRIIEIYNSGNRALAYQLASLYYQKVHPQYEIQLVKSSKKAPWEHSGVSRIEYYMQFQDRMILETRALLSDFGIVPDSPPLEPISPTNFPALYAVQQYYLQNGISLVPKDSSGGWKEFWKEHKKVIIVAAVVIVVVAVATIVIVTTAGGGTEVAVTSGAGAIGAVVEGLNAEAEKPEKKEKPLQENPQISEGMQKFANSIGATPASESSDSVTVIETESISEVTPETLINLVNDWNKTINPIIEDNELLIEEAVLAEENNSSSAGESIIDLARRTGSAIAHETVNAVGQVGSVVPQLMEEVRQVGEKLGLDRFIDSKDLGDLWSSTPQENFNSNLEVVHEKIDQVFSTDAAPIYSPDAAKPFTVGYIPLPIPGAGKIPVTQANNTWGWRLGDSIQNRTIFGTVPKWSTVRARYWKNEAYLRPENYNSVQLERMRSGLAPQKLNDLTGQIETMELHHIPPQREGGLFDFIPLWPEEHALQDKFRHLKK